MYVEACTFLNILVVYSLDVRPLAGRIFQFRGIEIDPERARRRQASRMGSYQLLTKGN